jgi:ABC-type dipeptide/oligopeptide/nickel transport system ATPase component
MKFCDNKHFGFLVGILYHLTITMKMNQLLQVRNLTVRIKAEVSTNLIVNDVSFSLEKGNVLAIVGESGSGKTTLCRALTRLFPISVHAEITGIVHFEDKDLLKSEESELQQIRQQAIRYIFPEPQQALNPVSTIRRQMNLAANSMTDFQLKESLRSVEIRNHDEVLDYYPHQLSIGMAQRVMIAMALLAKPTLLIADEPTSAVDASLRYQLLNLLRSLQHEHQMAMIIITHDLDVARKYADHVAVMVNGQIVETADCEQFFRGPKHPYSQSLLKAVPSISSQMLVDPREAQ